MLHFLSRITIPPERTFFYCTLFFVCLGFLVYGNSLDGEFIGDDMVLIVQNSNVQEFSIKSICRLFSLSFFDVTTSMGRIIPPEGGYYRPVCMVSYLLDYAVWKDIPFGYHLTNIILHIASSVLLFLFLQLMRKRTSLSFIVSTVFFIHPIHSRHVASLSGRTDLLCLVFLLLSLIAYAYYNRTQKSVQKNIYIVCSFLAFFCALLSKEMALMLPFIVILYDICFSGADTMRTIVKRWRTYGAFFLILILYLHIRQSVTGMGIGHFFLYSSNTNLYLRLLTCSTILLSFLKTFFIPVHLLYSWHYVPLLTSFGGKELWGACLVGIIVFSAAYVSWRKERVVFFGLGWFCITYFPVSNIIPVWAGIAEHALFVGKQFLHIPLIGLCITCIAFIFYCVRHIPFGWARRIYVWFFIVTVLTFSMVAAYNNIAWSNAFYYNVKVLEQIPESIDARNDLGIEYFKRGMFTHAVNILTMAIYIQESKGNRIKPSPNSYLNLIRIYYTCRMDEKVREVSQQVLAYFPHNYTAYYYLGAINMHSGDYQQAIHYSRKALQLNPSFGLCAQQLLPLLVEHSEHTDTLRDYVDRINDNSSDRTALFHLASLYRLNFLYERAIHYYRQTVQVDPQCYVARSNLAYCYEQLGMNQHAQEEREKINL